MRRLSVNANRKLAHHNLRAAEKASSLNLYKTEDAVQSTNACKLPTKVQHLF